MNAHERTRARERLADLCSGSLAAWCGQPPQPPLADALQALQPYLDLLPQGRASPAPGSPLLSIFSRVRSPQDDEPPQRYWRAGVLSLERAAEPLEREQARLDQEGLAALWRGFQDERQSLEVQGLAEQAHFEALEHLLHKWAWAVPGRRGEPGVSLYDEFRALSALLHASGCAGRPAQEFLLVGGDIPGIQDFVYTITSKGAAKGLRGRSFFVQLLSDAVVRRLLAELDLPASNVVYTAAGKFVLLAPGDVGPQVDAVAAEINARLLEYFRGDLAFCVAYHVLPQEQVGSGAFGSQASRLLSQALGQIKRRRFAKIAADSEGGWNEVFGAQGKGGPDFCSVCQREFLPGEKVQPLEDQGAKCERCTGFEELAQAIARERLVLYVGQEPVQGGPGWQRLLGQLTGQWYAFERQYRPPDARAYSVNRLDFVEQGTHGFRFIARTTPRLPDSGLVKTFDDMADAATGLKRVGVLRMDVDDLGQVFINRLADRALTSTSALSQALDRFFSGWLDSVCREVCREPRMSGAPGGREDLLYVIYAGGDDLFVVGAWDLMPLLAARIRERFEAYVGGNPHLHISAAVTLEGRKFPLYQAAERAGEALEHGAKELKRRVHGRKIEKDAINFLGQSIGWEEGAFPFVLDLAQRLIWLIQDQRFPRGLLTVLRSIVARYEQDVQRARERKTDTEQMYYGPWMWQRVYQIARMQQRYKSDTAQKVIAELETDVLTIENMPYVGLAARWAEYLTRGDTER